MESSILPLLDQALNWILYNDELDFWWTAQGAPKTLWNVENLLFLSDWVSTYYMSFGHVSTFVWNEICTTILWNNNEYPELHPKHSSTGTYF